GASCQSLPAVSIATDKQSPGSCQSPGRCQGDRRAGARARFYCSRGSHRRRARALQQPLSGARSAGAAEIERSRCRGRVRVRGGCGSEDPGRTALPSPGTRGTGTGRWWCRR
ncbi:hypothetical protein chiPu_0025625, partial [Chiloscyllium punctatum]|nr:hypothetical protein [Chiloscyllium punctatum]